MTREGFYEMSDDHARSSPRTVIPAQPSYRPVVAIALDNRPCEQVARRALAAWLTDHGFAELGGKATSHRRFRHESGVVITVPGHGKQNLSQKHIGMTCASLRRQASTGHRARDLNAR